MRMLLTGKNGQVGFELQRALTPLGDVHAVDSNDCDLADPQALRALIRRIQPHVIINPAAYTAVDKAEEQIDLAMAVNGHAPGIMGEEAARLGACVVHYSTDYVFDGSKAEPYVEDDVPAPLGTYGQSKLAGEIALQRATDRHIILRTSWVVGAHGNNFAKTVLRLAADRDRLSIVNDQHGAPTSAALLAEVTAKLIGQLQEGNTKPFPFGLYHLCASGDTTWFDYARFVLDYAEKSDRAAASVLKIKACDVTAIPSSQYPTLARRPSNSRLNTEKFRQTFGLPLPTWQEGLKPILDHIL
ncbi:NAD(P)-dependent oxidoreductase [Hydrogenophaga crassostreae]|uniref:dTDP-4-dehydrorhamnose reductase n=1 Tax=Hydrogenophaga crassostreae TaxID=1763535 RepID=A0A167H9C9_9BURK|nr:dTDP-4-dehydrorhamnose reductase [Hydrogenophaga crassostreae]AOW12665.1 dTDP-4-dehydrorhamnose reductase [Hydrogenophaga crassostreae]OAD40536.1 NAD(P)-dependent oxidoreductase [Hydrogenophaga crassostreae]